MRVLETEHLNFSYEKGQKILSDIHIKIERGSFSALLGANGCGKTTLLQHLNGLLKPTGGQVLLKGKKLGELPDREIFSTVGMVFQNPDDQLFALTVFEDVAYGVGNLGIMGKELEHRVDEALQVLNISDLKHREIHKLSFGQKKRAAIAGVLAMKPEILMLDEPTAGLDPLAASNLMTLLKQIQQEEQMTIIMTTHEVDLVPVYCDQVYVLHEGRIVLNGTPEDVFTRKEVLRKSSLRLPRIGHLVEVLLEKDHIELGTGIMTISAFRKALNELVDQMRGEKEK
jgi:cobalt/nickel transport system ATP-binding protein